MKKGKEYELLAEQIYKELHNEAEIQQDEKIMGVNTNTLRQIDVTIRFTMAGFKMLTIVQAKDYGIRRADVNVVSIFKDVIRDVRAQKGILICKSGFSKKALEYAKRENIEVYSAHTAINKKWELELSIPVIQYENVYHSSFSYGTLGSTTQSTLYPKEMTNLMLSNQPIYYSKVIEEIAKDVILDKSKEERTLNINIPNLYSRAWDYKWRPVIDMKFSYYYKTTKRKINYYKPKDYRVLKDLASDQIIASFINWDEFDLNLVDKGSWTSLNDDAPLPFNPSYPYIVLNSFNLYPISPLNFEFKNLDYAPKHNSMVAMQPEKIVFPNGYPDEVKPKK